MVKREGTRKIFGRWMAAALLATALGCSGGNDDPPPPPPTGTCSPVANPTANPSAAQSFCAAMYGAVCDRGFTDCVSEIGISGSFASAAECRTYMTSFACAGDFTSYGYDAACAASCVDVIQRGSCSIFTGAEPQACASALVAIAPPPPACTATIGAGTISDTITSADPLYHGGYSHTFCIALAANQQIRIETLAPTSGVAMDDTYVYLLDPTGAILAYNDDGGTGFYSLLTTTVGAAGQYRIVVRGFSTYDVGSYRLNVTLY